MVETTEILPSMIYVVVGSIILLTTIQVIFERTNYQGEDGAAWTEWEGYKAASSFVIANRNGEFGEMEEEELNSLINQDEAGFCRVEAQDIPEHPDFIRFNKEGQNCETVERGIEVHIFDPQRGNYILTVGGKSIDEEESGGNDIGGGIP